MKFKTEELLVWRYMTWVFESAVINPTQKTLKRITRLRELLEPYLPR